MSEKYNGWTNRETWLVNLYYGENLQDYVNDLFKQDDSYESYEIAECLEVWLDEVIGEDLENLPMFLKDFIVLSRINWKELAELYLSDLKSESIDINALYPSFIESEEN